MEDLDQHWRLAVEARLEHPVLSPELGSWIRELVWACLQAKVFETRSIQAFYPLSGVMEELRHSAVVEEFGLWPFQVHFLQVA